jgi:pSer/pThr/pTyr-binding forkhead associated (FHA) protein
MADLILEIVEGSEAGKQIPVDSVVDIGRDPSLPVSLEADSQVSRRHARVTAQGGGAVAEDLGSTNGTYVNEQPIHAPRSLNPGDRIRVGLTVFELRSTQQVAARASAVMPRPALTQVGNDVLAPVPEQQLAQVANVSPEGPIEAIPGTPPPPPPPAAEQSASPSFKAQETPAAFVPPEVIGDPEAESDYEAIRRLVDTRVKQQRNVAMFAMVSAAAIAVIIYFGLT